MRLKSNGISLAILALVFFGMFTAVNNYSIGVEDQKNVWNKSLQDNIGIKTLPMADTDETETLLISYQSIEQKNQFVNLINDKTSFAIELYDNINFIKISGPTIQIRDIYKALDEPYYQKQGIRPFKNLPIQVQLEHGESQLDQQLELLQNSEIPIVDGINARDVVDTGIDGQGVKLAIFDTGIDDSHPDLTVVDDISFIRTEYGFSGEESINDLEGHGTHVAGIAAGKGLGIKQFQGVAPGVSLYNYKVLNQYGSTYRAALIAAINYAVAQDIDIMSMSLGYPFNDPNDPIAIAVDNAFVNGVISVVSAGNSGNNYYSIGTPGSATSAVTVGATDYSKRVMYFSSRGPTMGNFPDPDIVAPGYQVISALATNSWIDEGYSIISPQQTISGNQGARYVALSGTSMSAPMVAGGIALLLDKYDDLTPLEVRAAIQNTAQDLGYDDLIQGAGLLDISAADEYLTNRLSQNNILSVLPKENFFMLNTSRTVETISNNTNPILFPGEELKTTFALLHPYESTYPTTLSITGSASDFFEIPDSLMINEINVSSIPITLQIPYSIEPGVYSAEISFKNANQEISVPVGPFTIRYPMMRVYWDNYHALGSETVEDAYLDLATIARNQQIQIDEFNESITTENLATYSVLALPSIDTTLSEEEQGAIEEFLANGNTVIVLADNPHLSLATEYNKILNGYGLALTNALVAYDDDGLFVSEKSTNMSVQVDAPIAQDEPILLTSAWFGGIEVEAKASSDATIVGDVFSNTSVSYGGIGLFNSNTTNTEKIVAIGDNSLLRGQNLGISKINFINQLLDFLKSASDMNLALNKYYNSTNQKFTVWGYITDELGDELSNGVELYNSSLILPTDTTTSLTIQFFNLNSSFSVEADIGSDLGRYEVQINSDYDKPLKAYHNVFGNEELIKSVEYSITDSSSSDYYQNWVDGSEEIVVYRGTSTLELKFNVNGGSGIHDELLLTSSVSPYAFTQYSATNIIAQKVGKSSTIELTYDEGEEYYSGSWQVPQDIPAGQYFVNFYAIAIDSSTNQKVQALDSFFTVIVANGTPEIVEDESNVGGNSLDSILSSNQLSQWNLGDKVQFEVEGTDINDNPEQMECFVAFLSYEFFFGVSSDFLKVEKLSYNSNSGKWTGDFQLPAKTSYPLENFNVAISIKSQQYFGFLIILRDFDGDLTYKEIQFQITGIGIDVDQLTTFFFFLLIPSLIAISVSLYLYFQKRGESDKYNDRDRIRSIIDNNKRKQTQITPKFCPNCGGKVKPGNKFCIYCGERLSKSRDDDLIDIDYRAD